MSDKQTTNNASSAKANGKISVKQIKSPIRRVGNQRVVLKGLGLGKIGRTRVLEDTSSIRGMIRVVEHLVEVTKS